MADDLIQDSQKIAEEVMQTGINELEKEYTRYIRPTIEEIRQSAKELVNYTSNLQSERSSVLNQIDNLNFDNEYSVLNFSKSIIKTEKEYSELMNLVFNFQEKVNQFLGQAVILTFVYISPSSGKVDLYAIEENMKAFKAETRAASKGGDINGRINASVIKKYGQKILADSDYNENGKKTLDRSFQETWQRFRISKSKFKMGGAAYILWKQGKDWDGRWVSGAGPLGEAYVAFFMNEVVFPSSLEKSVCQFILDNKYGVVAVDNASGFLQGDVTRGSMELAVKTGRAPAPGYKEIINYAKDILTTENVEEYLKGLKETLKNKGVKNAVKEMSTEIKKDVENELLPLYDKRDASRSLNIEIPIYK